VPKKALCLKSPETCNEVDAEIKIETRQVASGVEFSRKKFRSLPHFSSFMQKEKNSK